MRKIVINIFFGLLLYNSSYSFDIDHKIFGTFTYKNINSDGKVTVMSNVIGVIKPCNFKRLPIDSFPVYNDPSYQDKLKRLLLDDVDIITSPKDNCVQPAYNKSINKLLFVKIDSLDTQIKTSKIIMYDLITRKRKVLISNYSSNTMPCWGAENSKYFYVSNADGLNRIYESDTLGSNPKCISKQYFGVDECRDPCYSKNNNELMFVVNNHEITDGWKSKIVSINLNDGKMFTWATSNVYEYISPTHVSNDTILVTLRRYHGYKEIVVMDLISRDHKKQRFPIDEGNKVNRNKYFWGGANCSRRNKIYYLQYNIDYSDFMFCDKFINKCYYIDFLPGMIQKENAMLETIHITHDPSITRRVFSCE